MTGNECEKKFGVRGEMILAENVVLFEKTKWVCKIELLLGYHNLYNLDSDKCHQFSKICGNEVSFMDPGRLTGSNQAKRY